MVVVKISPSDVVLVDPGVVLAGVVGTNNIEIICSNDRKKTMKTSVVFHLIDLGTKICAMKYIRCVHEKIQ